MTPLVVAAVLVAAVTHAVWNALAHHIKDQLLAFTLVGTGGAVFGLAVAWFVPPPAREAWPALVLSAALHVVYQLLLMRSFGLGDFGQMYPVARGTAPLVVTVLAAVFLQEVPDAWQSTGVAVASAGLAGVALWGMRGRRQPDQDSGHDPDHDPDQAPDPGPDQGPGAGQAPSRRPALLASVATGLAIASYTVVDGAGVRAAGSPFGYLAWLMALQSLAIPAYAVATRRGRLLAELRPHALRGLSAGALSLAAYGLVLWAQTRAPLAPVAALRESSIIAGAAIGAFFFRERFGTPRVAASVLMVGGIALMLHGG